MTAKNLVEPRGARSRSQYMRFKSATEDALILLTPEGEERIVKPKFVRREKGEEKQVTPAEYAQGRFSPVARRTEIETIEAEMPFVRVAGLRDDGFSYGVSKVSTRYPKGTNSERTPYEDKVRARRETQDARQVVRGMGRTVVQDTRRDGKPVPYLHLIPEGHGPAEQKEMPAQDLYEHLKAEYRAVHRPGTRMAFTLSSIQGQDTYCEEMLYGPTRENEHQPSKDIKYPFYRPYTPDEFDAYIEKAKAGDLNTQEDRFAEALETAVRTGGNWKAVPVYRMLYGSKARDYYEPSGKIGNNLREDIGMARELKAEGATDPGWPSGDPITDTETFARYSMLGRVGGMHEGFIPMEVLEAEDDYARLPRVHDALIASAPQFSANALVFDRENPAGWHNGTMQSIEPTLDIAAPGEAAAEQASQTQASQTQASQTQGSTAQAPNGGAAQAGAAQAGTAANGGADALELDPGGYDDLSGSVPDFDEETAAPF